MLQKGKAKKLRVYVTESATRHGKPLFQFAGAEVDGRLLGSPGCQHARLPAPIVRATSAPGDRFAASERAQRIGSKQLQSVSPAVHAA